MVFKLNQCCCGCTLKTGTIILGSVDLVFAVIYLVYGITIASTINFWNNNQVSEETTTIVMVLSIITAVTGALLIVFSVLLLVGAVKSKPVLLVPWMVYTCLSTVTFLVSSIINTVSFVGMGAASEAASTMVSATINLALQVYFILVVNSLYLELKGERTSKQDQPIPTEIVALNKPPAFQETV